MNAPISMNTGIYIAISLLNDIAFFVCSDVMPEAISTLAGAITPL
jgi:hypothetical protein